MTKPFRTIGLWITICLACGWPLFASFAAGEETRSGNLPHPFDSISLEHIDQTRRRPLFSPTRRPPEPPVVSVYHEPPPPPPEPPNLLVLGVMRDGETTRAIVRLNASEKPRYVKIGDDLGGWSIDEITSHQVVLMHDTQSKAFTLFRSPAAPPKAAARQRRR